MIYTSNLILNQERNLEQIKTTKKSDLQQGVEDAFTIIEGIGELSKDKRKRDSIIIANKDSQWAIQIGSVKANRDQLWAAFEVLEKEVDSLFVFKESRKSFRIVKLTGNTPKEIEANLVALKPVVNGVSIKVIDLKNFCKARKSIKAVKDTRIRKAKVNLPTLECS